MTNLQPDVRRVGMVIAPMMALSLVVAGILAVLLVGVFVVAICSVWGIL